MYKSKIKITANLAALIIKKPEKKICPQLIKYQI